MSGLEVSVLGPLRATRGDAEVALGGRRQRSVLARLALAGGATVGAERLVDELWDGDPPRSALNTLQSYVSNLRRVMGSPGAPVIERAGEGYRLDVAAPNLASIRFERLVARAVAGHGDGGGDGGGEGDREDATPERRLATLDEALALWRGPALAEFCDEPWAVGDAVRLEELRLTAAEARFELLLDTGHQALVVGDLDAAATAHPLRERLTSLLVLALYRCGRQPEALRAYERTRAHLGDELGLDPSPDLVRLAARVLDHDPTLLPPETGPAEPPADPPPTRPEPRPATVPTGLLALPPAVTERRARSEFVGRDEEIARLRAAWGEVADGSRALAVVAGEPGMGKTRLVQQLARWAHDRGTHVFWGRCTAETLIPHQPIMEALRTATDAMGPEVSRALIENRPVLGRLLPGILPESAEDTRQTDRYSLYEALAELTDAVSAGRPVVLVLDDLQWADPSTLTLLDHVLGFERGGRLLVVATVRRPAGRATVELDRFLAGQRRARRTTEIDLDGLAAAAVTDLLADWGVTLDAGTAEGLRARTGGNPFFLESLAEQGALDETGDGRDVPESIRDVLDGRLATLDAEATAVLAAAAVIGLRVELDLLGRVTEQTPDRLLDVVDAAVAIGLLAEDEDLGWVTFPHALVRQALVARTTRNREARLHLKAATAFRAAGRGDSVAASVAEHLLAAGRLSPPERTARAALDAGAHALEVLADDAALTWAGRATAALDTSPSDHCALRAEAHLLMAGAQRHLGRREDGAASTGRAVAAARAAGDPILFARAAQEAALLEAGIGLSYGAVVDGLIDLLDEALDGLPAGHDAERSALLSWASIARDGSAPAIQAAFASEALALADGVGGRPHLRALALFARLIAIAGPDRFDERLELNPQMATAAAGWTEMEVIALVLSVTTLVEAGRIDQAEATLERLRNLVTVIDRPAHRAYLLLLDAAFALVRGDLDRGAALADDALETGSRAHGTNATLSWSAQQFTLARDRGTTAALAPLLEERMIQFPRLEVWRAVLAVARVAGGDAEGAREAYRPLFDDGRWASRRETSLWYACTGQVAEVAWLVGDATSCAALVPVLAPVSARMSMTGLGSACLGSLQRPYGLARAGAGDLDGAIEALGRAVEHNAEAGFAPWLARSLVDRATLLDQRAGPGDAEEAERCRDKGTAIAERIGLHLSLTPPGWSPPDVARAPVIAPVIPHGLDPAPLATDILVPEGLDPEHLDPEHLDPAGLNAAGLDDPGRDPRGLALS